MYNNFFWGLNTDWTVKSVHVVNVLIPRAVEVGKEDYSDKRNKYNFIPRGEAPSEGNACGLNNFLILPPPPDIWEHLHATSISQAVWQ